MTLAMMNSENYKMKENDFVFMLSPGDRANVELSNGQKVILRRDLRGIGTR